MDDILQSVTIDGEVDDMDRGDNQSRLLGSHSVTPRLQE